jgi:hypothetical protein
VSPPVELAAYRKGKRTTKTRRKVAGNPFPPAAWEAAMNAVVKKMLAEMRAAHDRPVASQRPRSDRETSMRPTPSVAAILQTEEMRGRLVAPPRPTDFERPPVAYIAIDPEGPDLLVVEGPVELEPDTRRADIARGEETKRGVTRLARVGARLLAAPARWLDSTPRACASDGGGKARSRAPKIKNRRK